MHIYRLQPPPNFKWGGGEGKGDKQQPLLGKFKFSTEATVLEVNSAKH